MKKKTKPKRKINAKKNNRPNRRSNAKPSDKQSDGSTARRSDNSGKRRPKRGTAGRDKDAVGSTPVESKRVPRIREIEVQRFNRKKMKMVTKTITIPKWEYDDLVHELARLMDVFGSGVVRKPDILICYKIVPEMLTPQIQSDATHHLHTLNDHSTKSIAKMRGSLNGKQLYLDATGEATTIPPLPKGSIALPQSTGQTTWIEGKRNAILNKTKRPSIFGHSLTSILKWMGREGWSLEDTTTTIKALEITNVAPSTIRTGWQDGKNPKYNKNAAPLTPEQIKTLEEKRGTSSEKTGKFKIVSKKKLKPSKKEVKATKKFKVISKKKNKKER